MTLRRTLQRSLSTTTRSLSQFGSGGGGAPSYDTDAQTYITAVEAADGQSLETGVKDAINAFVVGCKSDGIWTAIKASCILAGARTLSGALVPLVGTAPTNNNFVSGDYSRTAGLTGNAVNKYLNSNRASNSDPQDSCHLSCYVTTLGSGSNGYIGHGTNTTGSTHLLQETFFLYRIRFTFATIYSAAAATGFHGASRSASDAVEARIAGATSSANNLSQTPPADNHLVFARGTNASPSSISNAALAFYSIGESLDLADLDTRVTTLITDIGTALA